MAVLQDAVAFAHDMSLIGLRTAAITRVARQVIDSDSPDPQALDLAVKVMAEPTLYELRFSWALSTVDDLVELYGANDTDGVAEAMVAAVIEVWNNVAGTSSDV